MERKLFRRSRKIGEERKDEIGDKSSITRGLNLEEDAVRKERNCVEIVENLAQREDILSSIWDK